MISLLISVIVLCIIFGLIWWALSYLPLPDPFLKIAQFAVILIFVLILIFHFLLPLTGSGIHLQY